MDEQLKKDVETVQQAAGRQSGKQVEGDIITRAVPIDPTLEDAKAFVSDQGSPAGILQPHQYQSLSGTNYCAVKGCNAPQFADIHDASKAVGGPQWKPDEYRTDGTMGPGRHSSLDGSTEEDHLSLDGTSEWHKGDPRKCPRCKDIMAEMDEPIQSTWKGKDYSEYDAVNPPHYQRGPVVKGDIGSNITKGVGTWTYAIKCIDVMRAIKDPRLATAFKYIWRVAFGGKCEPGMEQATQRERDERDINSAVWYLQDWLNHEV